MDNYNKLLEKFSKDIKNVKKPYKNHSRLNMLPKKILDELNSIGKSRNQKFNIITNYIIVSCLLDAGSGEKWKYYDKNTNVE